MFYWIAQATQPLFELPPVALPPAPPVGVWLAPALAMIGLDPGAPSPQPTLSNSAQAAHRLAFTALQSPRPACAAHLSSLRVSPVPGQLTASA